MSWIDKDKRFLKKEEFLRIPTYNSYVTLDQEEKINVFLRFLKDMIDKYFSDELRENSKPLKFLQSFIEKNKDVEDIYKFNLELENYDILGLNKLILKDEVRKEYLKKNDSWDELLDFEESIKNRKNNTNIDVLGENRLTREHFEIYALEYYEGNTELINKYLEFLDDNFSIDRVNEVYNDYIISDLVNSLDDKIYEVESTIQAIEFGHIDSINDGLKIQRLKGKIELYEDLKNFLSGKEDKNEYILDKDLKIDGSFIAKGTSFFIEDFKDGKYGVHFEGKENNIYLTKNGEGYYFSEDELLDISNLIKIKSLYEKGNEITNEKLEIIEGLENRIELLKEDIDAITYDYGVSPDEKEEFYSLPKEEQDKINKKLEIEKFNKGAEIALYEDLTNFLLENDIGRKEYILNKDLNIDGSFIEKGTSFFIEGFKNGKFEVYFEGNENNSYKNDIGNGYYFDEFELSKMIDLTKIKELNGKEIEVYNNQYLYKTSEKKYSDNELHQKYDEWRTQRAEENQDKNNPFIWDCTEESARKDFSEFLGLKESIACDEMLGLEYKYEIGKIVNLFKEDYNLLGIEYPENALKNIDNSNIELTKEQLETLKDKSMNDLANEDRSLFSYLIKEKTANIFEIDINEYYDSINSIEKRAVNEDIYSLIDESSINRVIAGNLEEKINKRIDILVDLGIDKNFNYDISVNKVGLNDNLNTILAEYLNEGVEIRYRDALDEGQVLKSIKDFEDYAIDYLTPVSLDKQEDMEERAKLESEISSWNYKELLEFAEGCELELVSKDKCKSLEKEEVLKIENSHGMNM
ncbi:hypothetical protein [Clostridium perfringens]|uniref:hypothetical protein n=1 Tax=Clostridium perfringens TaxID=1502 RepID=UPI0030CA92B6